MTGTEPAAPRVKPSLRTELLLNIAVLAAGALVLAVSSALLAPLLGGEQRALFLTALVVADLAIFIVFGRYLIARLITGPIDQLVEATEAVAAGGLQRRAPEAATRELDRLAESVNRMTDRLLDAQSALVRAEKLASVGRLAAGIAHEVGNPLSAIGNYVEVLRRRGADPKMIAAVEHETGRIDAIVRSLLTYAKPGAVNREPVDLAAVAKGAVELLHKQGVLRPVDIEVRADDPPPLVFGDRVALEQVLVNLLLNAVDAAGEGGRIVVSVAGAVLGSDAELPQRVTDPGQNAAGTRRLRAAGRHLTGVADGTRAAQVLVSDSGPGVPADLVNRIFDPFFTTKEPGRGTGLGLAIVQRIVEDHGGRVDVRRAREGGAGFAVTLPPWGGALT
jgi:two-component system NtrC family sensor kinase